MSAAGPETALRCEAVELARRRPEGGERLVLEQVDAVFAAGQVSLVRGATGVGKSTLLHLLAGLLRPTRGTVYAGAEPISRWVAAHRDRWRQGVGVALQDATLLEGLSAFENVLLPLVPSGLRVGAARARATEALAAAGAEELAGAATRTLSGGERQRVALARAIVKTPTWLLVDEPTAHQDDAGVARVLEVLAAARARGAVVVVTAHDPRLVEAGVVDRRWHLDRGRLAAEGIGVTHPLVLAVLAADVVALLLMLAAARTAAKVLLGWEPEAAGRHQLALERGLEAASLEARAATGLVVVGTLLLALAVASVLPALVPGAMCGSGVMQATQGAGGRALALRGLAVAALATWHLLDRLDRSQPRAPLARGTARALLVATPLVLLAAWHTGTTFLSLDTHTAVDCCAAVYEHASGAAASGHGLAGAWLWGFAAGAALLVGGGLWQARWARAGRASAVPLVIGVLAAAWTPVAAVVLIERLAAYHYEVLHHHCPWCLFLGEHHAVGYALFGALAVAALEGGALAVGALTARRVPALAEAVARRARRAGVGLALAVLVFVALAVGPAVVWRLRFGVWMD